MFCLQKLGTICKFCFFKENLKRQWYLFQDNTSYFFVVTELLCIMKQSEIEKEKQLLANSKYHYPDR